MAIASDNSRTMDLLNFEATRKRTDERLNQELQRIRNLPKKSKITVCNKHGLRHAHHMNTGLVKSLEIDLNVLQREKRRVVNELNKTRRNFTTSTKKSFPDLLDQEKRKPVPNHKSPKRFRSSWSQADFANFKSQQNIIQEEHKKELLLALTEKSKQTTQHLIRNNIQRLTSVSSHTEELGPFVTNLNRRNGDFRKSCFPSLLEGDECVSYLRNRNQIPGHRTLESIREQSLSSFPDQTYLGRKLLSIPDETNLVSRRRTGSFKDTVNEKIILPSIKSKQMQNKFRRTVLMASKRKGMNHQGNSDLGKKTFAFTKHWS